MKKYIVRFLSVLSVFAFALSGCGVKDKAPENKEAKADNNSEVVALTVWGEEDTVEMLSQMVEGFKKNYADEAQFDITIEVSADSRAKDKLLSDIHNAADVFSFPDDQLIGMVAAGALVPVPDADTIKSANLEESVEAASLNGTLYAYPMTADNGYFMYYNKNYFTEEDVKSLERMLSVANAAGKKISMEFSSGWYSYAFFGNTGLEFKINDDGVTNSCNWNSTEGEIKGTDIAQSIMNIVSNPSFIDLPDGSFVDEIKSGNVIAGVSGVWNVMGVKEAWGDDYGAVKLPTYTCAGKQVQMSSFTGYKMMGVNAYSENKEWALKLADWLTNEENQKLRFEMRNQGPSNINAASSDEVNKVAAIQAVIDQAQYGNLQRVGNSYWEACTEFAETIKAGNPNGLSLQEIMDKLVAGITASAVE